MTIKEYKTFTVGTNWPKSKPDRMADIKSTLNNIEVGILIIVICQVLSCVRGCV
jgi:hypothetical protein